MEWYWILTKCIRFCSAAQGGPCHVQQEMSGANSADVWRSGEPVEDHDSGASSQQVPQISGSTDLARPSLSDVFKLGVDPVDLVFADAAGTTAELMEATDDLAA